MDVTQLQRRFVDYTDWLFREEEVPMPQKKSFVNELANAEKSSMQKITVEASSSLSSPTRNLLSQPRSTAERIAPSEPFSVNETSSTSFQKTEKQLHLKTSLPQSPTVARVEPQKPATPVKPTSVKVERPTQLPGISRPSSVPLMPGPKPSAPIVSMTRTTPLLARSSSVSGQLANEPSEGTYSYAPQSYKNAIMGKTLTPNFASFMPRPSTSAAGPHPGYVQPFSVPLSSPIISPQSSGRKDQSTLRSNFTFGSVTPDILQNRPQWLDEQDIANRHYDHSVLNGFQNLNICSSSSSGSHMYIANQFPANVPARQAQGVVSDEFPHLDIINYLLDDEHNTGRGSMTINPYNGHHDPYNVHHNRLLNRQYTFPGDMDSSANAGSSMNYSGFSRMERYHGDRMHQVYGSSSGHFDGLRDVVPVAGLSSYGNGHHMDEVIQNQWPVGGADLSMLSTRSADTDGYFYQLPEYSNLVRGVNGYGGMFHPSNGR